MDLEFLSRKFTEAELENAIIALFQEQGYSYAPDGITENEVKKIVSRLELIPSAPLYAGNRDAFRQ